MLTNGLQIIESRHVPRTAPKPKGHADWRQRLARNCARPSDGRWEPLHYMVEEPVIFMLADKIVVHPDNFHSFIRRAAHAD